jgi:hypothetical protein
MTSHSIHIGPGRGLAALALLSASALPSALGSGAGPLQIALALTSVFFVLGFVLNVLEGRLFSSTPLPIGPLHFVGALVFAAVAALAAGAIAGHTGDDAPWSLRLERWLGDRSYTGGVLRLVGVGATYVGVHGVIGMIAWPLLRKYYEDPALGLDLRIPPPRVMLPFQIARGIVGVLALLPWLLLVPLDRVGDWLALALTMAVTTGLVPLISMPSWPLALRFWHAVEITVIATLWSLLIWRITMA